MLDECEQAIRERAYALWEQDGRPEGRSLAHWSQAEAEIGTKQTVSIVKDRKGVKPRPARGAASRKAFASPALAVRPGETPKAL
jgi:hypothetical protein